MNKEKKIIFWGTPEFSLPSLKTLHNLNLIKLVITQPDKKGGRNRKLITSPVKEYSLDNNIKLLQPYKLDSSFLRELEQYLPATFVIIAYGKIIPQEVLNLSELQSINIHPSELPELRGPSPIQTALLKGFIDRALTTGFAVKYIKGKPVGLLKNKSARIIITMDASPFLSQLLFGNPGIKIIKNSILKYSGFKPIKITKIGPVFKADKEKKKIWLNKVFKLGSTD